ncbi:acyltransferase family protein [bacterium]|nr:acyltransferase family protein [bacterium]
MQKNDISHRSEWVDYCKAIGIILVVYGHVARGLFNAGIGSSIPWYSLVDSIVYSFHMPLFFFLSGLFFYSSFSKKGGGAFSL